MRDEFNGIYYSLFGDYKILSDLLSFRTTNSDLFFFQVLQSQYGIKIFLKKKLKTKKKRKIESGAF